MAGCQWCQPSHYSVVRLFLVAIWPTRPCFVRPPSVITDKKREYLLSEHQLVFLGRQVGVPHRLIIHSCAFFSVRVPSIFALESLPDFVNTRLALRQCCLFRRRRCMTRVQTPTHALQIQPAYVTQWRHSDNTSGAFSSWLAQPIQSPGSSSAVSHTCILPFTSFINLVTGHSYNNSVLFCLNRISILT